MITVKSGLDSGKIALFERDPKHPGGEVFIVAPGVFEVAETAAVMAALGNGRLVRVQPEQPAVVEPEPEPAPRRRGK